MEVCFSGEIWYWRGPAPHYFVTVPEEFGREIEAVAGGVSYGWGMIPVEVTAGRTTWTTSMFPKNGSYIVPIKAAVRAAEDLDDGDEVDLRLDVATR